MMDETTNWHSYRDAISASAGLAQEDRPDEALKVLDKAVALAISEKESRWVLTLSHHAAVIASSVGDRPRTKQYYEQSLACNPENPRALLGLANVAKEQGELEQAKQYAARCYKSLREGDDFLKGPLLETLLKKWPAAASY